MERGIFVEFFESLVESADASSSALIYVFVFVSGVVASLTPCVYPVLPLTVGYVGNAAKGSKAQAFLLSLAMVVGMALVYAVMGMVVAAVGGQFGSLWGNGWVVYAIAMFFIVMALFLMDVFTFPTPRFLQNLQAKSGRREGVFGALLVGGVSGLVVGPCTGPILAVVLALVTRDLEKAQTHADYALQMISGGVMLFLFGLGQGALILLCGTFAGLLTMLPKAGMWMNSIKKGFAMLIIVGASFLLIHVGQNTDFPNLIKALSTLEGDEEDDDDEDDYGHANAAIVYGGDEILLDAPPADAGTTATPTGEATLGGMAPPFVTQTHDGKFFSLPSVKGKRSVLLVFFATWCAPCMAEVPHVKELAEEAKGKGVLVYGVNYGQTEDVVERFVEDERPTYRVLYDKDRRLADLYGLNGVPFVVGITPSGAVGYYDSEPPESIDDLLDAFKKGGVTDAAESSR